MKIRSDFVTNSSSSSYVVIEITSNTFCNILRNFTESLSIVLYESCNIDNDTFTLNSESACCGEPPEGISDLISSFINMLEMELECREEASTEFKEITEMIAQLNQNCSVIENEVSSVLWSSTDYGWDGDDCGRFDESMYPAERLREIKEVIIKENKDLKDISDITDSLFESYVSDKMSISESKYCYDKKKEIDNLDYDYRLEG